MKVLEPVSTDAIPRIGPSRYEELYQRVLFLNGLALPVEFEGKKKAVYFASTFHHPRSRAKRLGLRATQRGNTVFVYRKDATKAP